MTYNPKLTIGAAILFFLLSIVGAYFGVTRTKSLETVTAYLNVTESLNLTLQADLKIKEAQLKRAYALRTTSTPVLVGDKVAYIKTSETLDNSESRITEYTAHIEQLTQVNARLQDTVDRLAKVETSKSGLKRWGTMAKYNFPHWEAGLGLHQDLGIVDLGLYGLLSVPQVNQYSVALNARF